MKIYHTQTQADYDALMVELEVQGCKWVTGRKPTESKDWCVDKEHTYIKLKRQEISRVDSDLANIFYIDVPITKYKAKADEKMKFTKENVKKVIDEYFWEAGFNPCGDLIAAIDALDDTPEKVVVPKFVADYLIKAQDEITLMRVFEIANAGNELKKWKKEYDWIRKNSEKFAKAWIDGYTIEPEELYYIPLPHLELSDGTKQVLSKRKGDKRYFANYPTESLQQEYTKAELEQVPEIYKPYATPVEEEEE